MASADVLTITDDNFQAEVSLRGIPARGARGKPLGAVPKAKLEAVVKKHAG